MADITVDCASHVIYFIVSIKFREGGLGMSAFDSSSVVDVSEEEIVNRV